MVDEKILTKTISNGAGCCDYRLVKYKIHGKWTKPILEYNEEIYTNGDWHMTEVFEHLSHGDIAYMVKEFGMRFSLGYDEELIQTDKLVEFKEGL